MRAYVPKGVDNIAVWGLDGHNIAALDRRSTTRSVNVADRAYFVDSLSKRDFAFEGPTMSRTTGVAVILFARPIFDSGNRVIGVISMALRADDLVTLLDQNGLVTESSLVTSTGT